MMMLCEYILVEKHSSVSEEDISNEIEALVSTMNNEPTMDAAFIGDSK